MGFTAEKARETYDDFAPVYDQVLEAHRPDVAHFVELACLKPGESVLDLGCGTGWAAIAAKKVVGGGRVVGVDISAGMLGQAVRNIDAQGMKGQIALYPEDITAPPTLKAICEKHGLPGFDVIMSCWTFGDIPSEQQPQTLRTWSCFLSPNGRLVVDRKHGNDHLAVAHAIPPTPAPDKPRLYVNLADPEDWEETREQFARVIRRAGLATVSMHPLQVGSEYEDNTAILTEVVAREWARQVLAGRQVGEPARAFREEHKQEMVKRWEASKRAGGYVSGHKNLVFTAIVKRVAG